ncbi:hypothetical protein DOTSEDRAFT_23802 [Dothistroma septosporum NZE10]|uniref:SnoaL-like domain-containing protein n=1 Tax=Dothistroma septosporum (strain NZE10 / CBS 128990) TaxID=675120 RepID=N1PSB7_DOTSN|nr:hypothetical protein DOTSEDRAFT_23802 [Dothistroma septosporum NZE10]
MSQGSPVDSVISNTSAGSKLPANAGNTEKLLEYYSVDILDSFNKRDLDYPTIRYGSDDYQFECIQNDGSLLELDAPGMKKLREWFFVEHCPQAYGEVLDVMVHLDELNGNADVWVTYTMHNDKLSLSREKVTIFFWKRRRVHGTGEYPGEQRWEWVKEYTSAGTASVAGDANLGWSD